MVAIRYLGIVCHVFGPPITHKANLAVFNGVQNLVRIHAVVSIIMKVLIFLTFIAWKCVVMPRNYGFGGIWPLSGRFINRTPKCTSVRGKTSQDLPIVKIGVLVRPVCVTSRLGLHFCLKNLPFKPMGQKNPKLSIPLEAHGPPSNTPIPRPTHWRLQTASRSNQPFCHTPSGQTDRQTHTQTDRRDKRRFYSNTAYTAYYALLY